MVSGIEALEPPETSDPHVLYNLHFYEPYVFSHQGAVWMTREPMYRYFRDVPWPASAGDERATRDAAVARIKADAMLAPGERDTIVAASEHALAEYFAADPSFPFIQGYFEKVAAWRERRGIDARRVRGLKADSDTAGKITPSRRFRNFSAYCRVASAVGSGWEKSAPQATGGSGIA